MEPYEWTDENGYKRRVLLPRGASRQNPEYGVPSEPPPIDSLDWEGIQRDLHNELLTAGLLTWHDVQNGQNRLTSICRRILIKRLIDLYRSTMEG